MENLEALTNLESLDISFNRLRKIQGIENLVKLRYGIKDNSYGLEDLTLTSSTRKLYLVSNKITKIENVNHLRDLQLLELGDNRIRSIENLEGLENLKELYIGKNKIAKIDNLSCCPKLR